MANTTNLIVSIVGARPNFIKLASVNKVLDKQIMHLTIHTGQHYDYEMSKAFFKQLDIPDPNYNLKIGSKPQAEQILEITKKAALILKKLKPKLVIVYGDTNSTVGGALASALNNIQIAHVEAGIRCFDDSVPEEVNRKIVDRLSSILLCPSEQAVKNLKAEGINKGIYLVGDVMLDLLKTTSIKNANLNLPGVYILATIHRQENLKSNQLAKIIRLLNIQNARVVMPVHPHTAKLLKGIKKHKNLIYIKPVAYQQLLYLIKNSTFVITDSGGIQKEAYWLKRQCFTVRRNTEWPETVLSGANQLINSDSRELKLKDLPLNAFGKDYYGNGQAAMKINKIIKDFLIGS